ncbi:MAG: hypothetical protein IJ419_11690 [Agathobacter sp.]|nr:hypothetical protein [Agathobacter sp.]
MAKIEKYTLETMLNLQDQYFDMVEEIENRALEIAKNVGIVDSTYIVNDVEVGDFDGHNLYVHACFIQMGLAENDDEPATEHYKFPVDWLFSDDYLKTLPKKDKPTRTPEEEREYQEYLRLKKKFESN